MLEKTKKNLALLTAKGEWAPMHVLKVFLISRAGLFLIVYGALTFFPAQTGRRYWHAFPQNRFLDGWVRFDAGWYGEIAKHGYRNIPTPDGQDTNFFPLYPLLMRIMGKGIGNIYLAGILLSNTFFLFTLLGLYRLLNLKYGKELSERAITLLAFNPFSFFFSAVYAESLFLFFLVYAFYFCERENYLTAGICAAAAGATRNLGIFSLIGIGLLALEKVGYAQRELKPAMGLLWVGLAGPLLYMAFLNVRFHDPLLFLHAQKAWGSFSPVKILCYMTQTFQSGMLRYWGIPLLFLFHLFLGLLAVFAVLKERKMLGLSYTVFSLLMILPGFLRFTSLGRYLLVVFPLYGVLGKWTRQRGAYWALLIGEGSLLVLFSVMFGLWYWVA